MSSIDDLADSILNKLENDKYLKAYRNKKSNRKPHTFVGNKDTFKAIVYQGIRTQRSKGWNPTQRQDSTLDAVVTKYLSNMYSMLSASSSSKIFSYDKVYGTPTNFKVVIRGEGVVEGHIKLLRDRAGIHIVSNTIKKIFDKPGKKTSVDLGHIGTSTIAAQAATAAISRFESVGNVPISTSALEQLKVLIKYDPLSSKLATIYVEDQLDIVNQGTTEEAKISSLLSKALGKEFIRQEASNLIKPRLNNEINKLLDIAKKSGAKTSKKLKVDRGGSTAKTKKLQTKTAVSGKTTVDRPDSVVLSKEASTQDWSYLIRILNARLPEQVAKNMTSPKLVYRTGRFANSTKVVGIEFTKEEYPTFVYDYQKNPYGIFERGSSSPLATPARDPKTLVALSIREIVKELAIDRFYTRRA